MRNENLFGAALDAFSVDAKSLCATPALLDEADKDDHAARLEGSAGALARFFYHRQLIELNAKAGGDIGIS